MEQAVEMKIAEFAKTNRVNKTKLFALVEEVLGMSKVTRTNNRVEKMESRKKDLLVMVAEKGRITVRELEAAGVKNARYTVARLQEQGVLKRADKGVKMMTKGRANIAFELV